MKKNKGFTLIELLAIIVILAIIAVITVPIILNIIENSKVGAATDSAYGYKDAINKWYVSKLSSEPNFNIEDGTYTTDNLKELGVALSGKEPGTNSWVSIEKNNVKTGCLQFDEYKVDIENGKVTTTEKGECEDAPIPQKPIAYANKNDSTPKVLANPLTDLVIGDYVTIGSEGFYVINPNKNGNVVLLAEYNLLNDTATSTWKQGTQDSYNKITFSNSEYWKNEYASTYSLEQGDGDANEYYAFVYTNQKDDNDAYLNNLYEPMETYKTHLINLGLSNSITIRPMTRNEAINAGINATPAPSWSCNQEYWLGTDHNFDSNNHYWELCSVYNGGGIYCYNFYNNENGIRPVIEISPTEFN